MLRALRKISFVCLTISLAGCLANRAGAPEGVFTEGASGTVDTTCDAYLNFQQTLQPLLYSQCNSCHGAGQSGSSRFQLTGTNPYSEQDTIRNYLTASGRMELSDPTAVSDSDLIRYPAGYGGHPNVLSIMDQALFEEWADQLQACPLTE